MTRGKGTLTGIQLDIMDAVWSAGADGVCGAEIRDHLRRRGRRCSRTTVVTLLARLKKRGWLEAKTDEADERRKRYFPARERNAATDLAIQEFADEYDPGWAAEFTAGLLGSGTIKSEDLARMRKIIDEAMAKEKRK